MEEFNNNSVGELKDVASYSLNKKLDSGVRAVSPLHIKLAAHQLSKSFELEMERVLLALIHQRLIQDFGRKEYADGVHQWTSQKSLSKVKFFLGMTYVMRQASLASRWLSPALNKLRDQVQSMAGEVGIRVGGA